MTLTNSCPRQFLDGPDDRLVRATNPHFFVASRRRALQSVVVVVALSALLSVARARAAEMPDFSSVSQAVQQSLGADENYEPGDLITQSQVKNALNDVARVGWEIPDSQAIVKMALADNSFMAKELSSSHGKKFMRRITKYPGAFSRLDQLSTISRGHQVVRELIRAKGGDDLIQYMATTKGGEKLGHMIAGAQHGVDLNKPTGRIYTAEDLIALLKRIYTKPSP